MGPPIAILSAPISVAAFVFNGMAQRARITTSPPINTAISANRFLRKRQQRASGAIGFIEPAANPGRPAPFSSADMLPPNWSCCHLKIVMELHALVSCLSSACSGLGWLRCLHNRPEQPQTYSACSRLACELPGPCTTSISKRSGRNFDHFL